MFEDPMDNETWGDVNRSWENVNRSLGKGNTGGSDGGREENMVFRIIQMAISGTGFLLCAIALILLVIRYAQHSCHIFLLLVKSVPAYPSYTIPQIYHVNIGTTIGNTGM